MLCRAIAQMRGGGGTAHDAQPCRRRTCAAQPRSPDPSHRSGQRHQRRPGTQPLLRAQLIELVDASGVVRGQLKTEDGGDVVFRLLDRNGTVRVKLGASEMGSGLLLADDQTDVGVHILAGVSKLTHERNTMITVAAPGNVKRVIRPRD
jgi:hypothetical protein